MIILLHRGIKKQPAMKVNKGALLEYECLKPNDLFIYQNKKKTISDNTLTILVHNARSISKHVNDIVMMK